MENFEGETNINLEVPRTVRVTLAAWTLSGTTTMSGSKPQTQHLSNNAKSGSTKIRGHKGKPEFTGYFSQRGGLKKPAGSTMGNTLDNAFRIELTTTPQAGTWPGASFLITFNVIR